MTWENYFEIAMLFWQMILTWKKLSSGFVTLLTSYLHVIPENAIMNKWNGLKQFYLCSTNKCQEEGLFLFTHILILIVTGTVTVLPMVNSAIIAIVWIALTTWTMKRKEVKLLRLVYAILHIFYWPCHCLMCLSTSKPSLLYHSL